MKVAVEVDRGEGEFSVVKSHPVIYRNLPFRCDVELPMKPRVLCNRTDPVRIVRIPGLIESEFYSSG